MITTLFLMMATLAGQAVAQYPPLREYMMGRDAEIALAKSAAPANISDHATVKVLTASGYEVVDQGNNGFVLSRNPHVILTTGCNHWNIGKDVVVEGDAVQLTDNDALERLAKAWTRKWDRQWQYEVREGAFHHKDGGAAIVFSVRPTKILAFRKGTFS